jgi:hypothetical protein
MKPKKCKIFTFSSLTQQPDILLGIGISFTMATVESGEHKIHVSLYINAN